MPLELRNVQTNNLKSLNLTIDPLAITAVCGVSGSGKTSLVFDTIHAESQRRYLETFSPKVREQFAKLPRPVAEAIDGVPPTIALPQDPGPAPQYATVGSESELLDLFSQFAAPRLVAICPICGRELVTASAAFLADRIEAAEAGSRFMIGFPVDAAIGDAWALLTDARFGRAVADGVVHRLDEPPPPTATQIDGVVDRVVAGRTERTRLLESFQMALRAGRGRCSVFRQDDAAWAAERFTDGLSCTEGHFAAEPIVAEDIVRIGRDDSGEHAHLAAASRLEGRPLRDWLAMPAAAIGVELRAIAGAESASAVVQQVERRVGLLDRLSLGELSMVTPLAGLSHGERQRLRLASVVASESVGSLVILDEPTAALAPAEAAGVIATIDELASQGNGVLLVEHRLDLLKIADRIIEIGPKAGADGGQVVFDGDLHELVGSETATSRALREKPGLLRQGVAPIRKVMSVRFGDAVVDVPIDRLTVLSTARGRAPSRFIQDLFGQLASADSARVAGADAIEDVVALDQAPASRSPRSCIATATKALDEIRAIFAAVPEAKSRGMTVRHFSFNAPNGGRCPQCLGQGVVSVAMAHLSDVPMDCPRCGGRRYAADVLTVKYRRRSIADVLSMTVDEALAFFRTEVSIHRRLQPVKDVGLGYLSLGRSLPSLSGGESQRLKLATHLTASTRGRVLFLLDEPSRGLHPLDAVVLSDSLRRLLEVGHTVVAAEHSPVVMSAADWIVEFAGDAVAYAGPPEQLRHEKTELASQWFGASPA